jgi:aldose 1-epimerase
MTSPDVPQPIDLVGEQVALQVLPGIGGGVARFDRLAPGGLVPLFRRWDGRTAEPNALGCYPLIPFSNRLGGCGIEAGGRFWPLPANRPPDPYPLHGDGWELPWRVVEQAPTRLVLGLASRRLAPFDYAARLTYALAGASLTIRLEVEHRGEVPVPYGLGLHPWLPRTPGTTLEAPAEGVWLETADHLPDREVPVAERPDWDFRTPRRLPEGWLNNAFTGWTGKARVTWPETGTRLEVAADNGLGTLILFSPGTDCDFLCLEPVSHPVDAHRLPGQPGLRLLHQGESFAVACRFTASEIVP